MKIKELIKKIFTSPVYPILYVTYYYLYLYAANISKEIGILHVFVLWAVSLLGIVGLGVFLFLFLKDIHKSAFVVAVGAFLFFSFGAIGQTLGRWVHVNDRLLLISFGIILAGAVVWALRSRKDFRRFDIYLNMMFLILMVLPIFNIVMYQCHNSQFERQYSKVPEEVRQTAAQKPDIYYIILDAYGQDRILKEFLNFDNSDFIRYLKGRGFYIAEDALANYYASWPSMACSLNMQYLDFLTKRAMEQVSNTGVINLMIRYPNVVRTLKTVGYQYILIDSGISPTDTSPLADERISYDQFALREIHMLMANQTALKVAPKDLLQKHWRQRIIYNFDELGKIPKRGGKPKFVFAHFVVPHGPFVFDRDGNLVTSSDFNLNPSDMDKGFARSDADMQHYLNQLIYVNQLVKKVVDQILATSLTVPVIIIQSDHGLAPRIKQERTELFIAQRAPILNAYLVPEALQSKLYQSISPVNTFRVILDYYFQRNFPLLKDRSIYMEGEDLFKFTDETDVARQAEKKSPSQLSNDLLPASDKK